MQRGTICNTEVLQSSCYHRIVKSMIQCYVGIAWFNYDVTWTDYRDRHTKSTIDDAEFVGSIGCTLNNIEINKNKVVCIVDYIAGTIRDKCTIGYYELETYN